MRSVLAAPLAKFGKLNFPFHLFLIFAAPIADSFAGLALQFYQVVLRHLDILADYLTSRKKASYTEPGENSAGCWKFVGALHWAPSQTPPWDSHCL